MVLAAACSSRQHHETLASISKHQAPAEAQKHLDVPPGYPAADALVSPLLLFHQNLQQVHVAYSHDGRKLAVKVQHAGLRESCTADVATIEFLVKAAKVIFPDFDYMWLVEETKQNLPLELDFTHEMQNANRCRQNISSPRSTVARRWVTGGIQAYKPTPAAC